MKARQFKALVEDLIHILPQRGRADWQLMADVDPALPTVVLVSGFAATNRNLSVMRKRLVRDGFNVIVIPMDWQALSDGVRGLYRMSEKLSSTILQLRKGPCRGDRRLYIVAHSAGGLVARHYIQILGGSHYCDGLVTLATPHRGTWLSALGFLTHLILKARVLFQMLPFSPFIRKLNRAPFPHGFHFVSISSSYDLLCPRRAGRLPPIARHQPDTSSLELNGLTHSQFLLSKRIYRLLVTYLKKEEPTAPLIPDSGSTLERVV